jgi:hypothetical protein
MGKSKKEILKKIQQEGKIITPDVLDQVYKTIGIDPSLLGKKEKIIEKRLKSEADSFVPQNRVPIYATEVKTRPSLRALFQKPRFVSLMATAMVAVILSITFITLGINGFFVVDPTDTTGDSSSVSSTAVPLPIQNDQKVISVGALTSNVLFDYNETSDVNGHFRALLDESDGDIIFPQISPYLEMIEQLMSSEGQLEVISEESDREEYDYKDIIVARDTLGIDLNYIIYYSVDELNDNNETATYRFSGIIIYGDSDEEYQIVGKREIEEDEAKVSMHIYYSEGDYIHSEYKEETDEAKYRFRVYENNNLISDSSLKFEDVDGELKLKLVFGGGDNTYVYDVMLDEQTPSLIRVDYKIQRKGQPNRNGYLTIEVVVDEESGETKYTITVYPKDGNPENPHDENRGHGQGRGNGNGQSDN